MDRFSVVGIGPGHISYILPVSLAAIDEADLLIGGERHLALFAHKGKETLVLTGDYSSVFPFIRENYKEKKIAVLVSGDPGYHSLLRKISLEFTSGEYSVFPGISSFQLAMSRIGKVWNDAHLISLHGVKIEQVDFPNHQTLIMLTDYKNTPWRIARELLERGFEKRTAYICENLSYDNERIREIRLEQIEEEEYRLCVMIIEQ